MKGVVAFVATFALFAAGVAVSGDEPTKLPVPAKGRMNIEMVRTLDAKGGYIRLEGRNLFLTSDVAAKGKEQPPGFWFDLEPDPAAPRLVDKSLPAGWDVAVVGNYAFLCDYTPALTVACLRDRQWKTIVRFPMPNNTENIVVRGKLAYIANHTSGLTIVDIAAPEKPSIVGKLNPRIDCDGIALHKDYAVLYGHWESRLVLVDITNPAEPKEAGLFQHEKGSFNQGEVRVDGGFAYCTGVNGLTIADIRDPANPKLVKVVALKSVSDVEVADGYVFVPSQGGVHVLDIADPAKPVEVGRYVDGGRLAVSELAVQRVAPTAPPAAASYYIYAANRRGPAMVMLFQPPHRAKSNRQ